MKILWRKDFKITGLCVRSSVMDQFVYKNDKISLNFFLESDLKAPKWQ